MHKLATQPYSSIMSVAANGKPLCLLLVLTGVCYVGDLDGSLILIVLPCMYNMQDPHRKPGVVVPLDVMCFLPKRPFNIMVAQSVQRGW